MARVYKNCSCFPARLTEDYPCEEAIRRQTAAALGAIFPVVLTVVLPHSKITRAAKQKRRSAALHRLAVESCPQCPQAILWNDGVTATKWRSSAVTQECEQSGGYREL